MIKFTQGFVEVNSLVRPLRQSIQQPSSWDCERLCELFDNGEAGIALAAFDIADVCAMDTCPVGIVLLAPAVRFTKTTNIPAKACAYIHADPSRPVSPIDLQTISDICR